MIISHPSGHHLSGKAVHWLGGHHRLIPSWKLHFCSWLSSTFLGSSHFSNHCSSYLSRENVLLALPNPVFSPVPRPLLCNTLLLLFLAVLWTPRSLSNPSTQATLTMIHLSSSVCPSFRLFTYSGALTVCFPVCLSCDKITMTKNQDRGERFTLPHFYTAVHP